MTAACSFIYGAGCAPNFVVTATGWDGADQLFFAEGQKSTLFRGHRQTLFFGPGTEIRRFCLIQAQFSTFGDLLSGNAKEPLSRLF